MKRIISLIALGLIGLGAVTWAEEPTGFREIPWGSPWDMQRFKSLPGCDRQGSVFTFLTSTFVEVVHPECVDYKLSEKVGVNLVLTFADTKMSSLEGSQMSLRHLVLNRRMWGLTIRQAEQAELRLIEVDKFVSLRRLNGIDPPVFPDMADQRGSLPATLLGLQAYQINFSHEHYASIKAAAGERFGPPTSEVAQAFQTLGGATFSGERLLWIGEKTIAILREYGGTVRAGYLAIATRGYAELLASQRKAADKEIKRGF